MKRWLKSAIVCMLLTALFFGQLTEVKADSVDMKSYIAFGADLTSSEKSKVMGLLGVTEADLANYEVVEITNQDEHDYLDGYLSENVIGSRALSSVKVERGAEGSGIGVDTENISYCSSGMYCNALLTAGVEDAMVTVAGPFKISGTAALVGVMKSYSIMTGEEIDSESADAATNELVVTGELGETVGADKAADFFALAKQKVIEGDLSSEEEINTAIDEAAASMNVSLTDAQKAKIAAALDKIKDLDLDADSLKDQVKDIYNNIKDMGIDVEGAQGFFEEVGSFFADLGEKISAFFSNLFS